MHSYENREMVSERQYESKRREKQRNVTEQVALLTDPWISCTRQAERTRIVIAHRVSSDPLLCIITPDIYTSSLNITHTHTQRRKEREKKKRVIVTRLVPCPSAFRSSNVNTGEAVLFLLWRVMARRRLKRVEEREREERKDR
jgi:hypothetical protein